ncbi:hypothetical protein B0H11DRAFT_2406659, partial [Mycena galericulata]
MDATLRLNNLRESFHIFHSDVLSALHVMVGDPPRLNAVRDRGLALASAAEQHRDVFPAAEYGILQTSISDMVTALDVACYASMDPPDAAPLVVARRVRTGRRGRPRVEIDSQFLSAALELRGPTGIAPEIGVCSRTIRRAALRAGLVQPGAPVFQNHVNPDGGVDRVHTSTGPPVSAISDTELDQLLASTLEIFPQFGRRMIRGHLKSQGYRIPRERITLSYLRLIRYKMVIHCIIDGYSRFVLGIRVHDNNRGASVLQLFMDAITNHGCPSRMRVNDCPYCFVINWISSIRSVHNTRIERLWYDVTHGFGKKWKVFFLDLETNHGLNP